MVITIGCGDTWPVFPGKRSEDWDLPGPAGRPIECVRQICEIRVRIEAPLRELLPAAARAGPIAVEAGPCRVSAVLPARASPLGCVTAVTGRAGGPVLNRCPEPGI